MKFNLFFAFLLTATFAFSQGGNEKRNLSEFSRISVHEGIEVELKKGSSNTADISVDNVDLDEVLTEVSNGKLKIHMAGNNYRNVDVEIVVTYSEELEELDVSSAGSINVNEDLNAASRVILSASSAGSLDLGGVTAESVELEVSSSGDIDVEVQAEEIEASASSAGEINLDGSCDVFDAEASSSGEINAYSLKAKTAYLSASSGADLKCTVIDKLRARASSGGSIRYNGTPKNIDKSSSSGGSIRG